MGKKKKWNRPLCDNTNQCFPQGEFCINVEHTDSGNFQAFEPRLGVPAWSARQGSLQSQLRCEICERVFQYPSQLRDHTLIHTRVRRFVCQVCGMKFMKEHHLKAHQATHSAVKPFACPICARAFTLKANMERHTHIHSAERRFTCETCGKKFSQPQTLKMHLISHSEVKPFACSVCGKGLSRAHNLRAHMAIHRSSKPFKCHLCNSSFTLKGNMQRHLKEKHGVADPEQHTDRDPPPPSLSGESFILSLDPNDAVGSSPAASSRLSEDDNCLPSNCQNEHLPQQHKRRKNTPKRVKCEQEMCANPGESPPPQNDKGCQSPHQEHNNNNQRSDFQQPNGMNGFQQQVIVDKQNGFQQVNIDKQNGFQQVNMDKQNGFQQVNIDKQNGFQQVVVDKQNGFQQVVVDKQNFQQQQVVINSFQQLTPMNVPSEHKPFTPCALPLQGPPHSGFGPAVSVTSFLPRPPGFYADSGMLVNPFPAENVESRLQTIHSAIDDLAGKLSSPHEKVMAIHEALDELVHLRQQENNNNFRCVKNERMGN
ncbi:hypothetical protein JTE90_023031 [Oedothorax gibbosus]|uniref:C2H2-type domain-containing protein n=1 Tax=Oedothorax gibbosus TaxID=931172 RepID=A0AAV6V2H9_9ARAC|nr:hypothetical protein JTE90_023031 [Oedothorax gibbosus]